MRKVIFHIYWGTAGNAGLYLDEIYQALNKAGYKQKAFVSYYYPFSYGEKVFFKRTEMQHCKYKGTIRRALQAIEFLVALCKILFSVWHDRPCIINYSYVNRGNTIIRMFLKIVKRTSRGTLVITCHDVIPIIKNENQFLNEISVKKKILALADFYLVHTDNSKEELKRIFDIRDDQILKHPFPLMDLSKIDKERGGGPTKYDFLFIGHMRPEKGIDILISAWKKFHEECPDSKLCIAGNPNYYNDYLEAQKNWCIENDVDLRLSYISDDDYIRIVKSSKCVLFPYTGGTNSGVISTVVSLGRDVITSDLGMFINNPFVPKENMFETGKVDSLVEKLREYKDGVLVSDSIERVRDYRRAFDEQVNKVYKDLLVSVDV